MSFASDRMESADGRIGLYRLLIGLIQGLAIYGLVWAGNSTSGNPVAAGAFAAILLAPAVLLAEIGRMPVKILVLECLAAAVVLGLLGAWADWRDATFSNQGLLLRIGFVGPAGAALLFITHHLVVASIENRRWIAPYADYFDAAWRHGLQVALSGLFLGLFWIMIELGAALLGLIGQTFLRDLIKHDWFWIPVSAVVFAGAIHLTDVRIGMIRGFRTLVLSLFSVLLPLMATLSAVFLVLGAFTGMRGVWKAQSAAAILLAVAAAMVVFLNAAYQDGAEERRPGRFLRWTMRAAPFLVLALVALSANTVIALVLRYGLTPERIVAAAGSLILFAYGAGYAWAVFSKADPFMGRLEITNVLAAHLTLAIGIFLLSPLGDPARLSVDSQVHALVSGQVVPVKFDWNFLANRSARFGQDAIRALKRSSNPDVAARAKTIGLNKPGNLTPADRLEHIQVFPLGAKLPPGVLELADPKARNFLLPNCLYGELTCTAYVIDLNHDGHPDVLFAQFNQLHAVMSSGSGWTIWSAVNSGCLSLDDALKAGQITLAPPTQDDVLIGQGRYRLAPTDVCGTPPKH